MTSYNSLEDSLDFMDELGPNLILDGNQQTDIWVKADSIPDFNVYFERKALTLSSMVNLNINISGIQILNSYLITE